jgi:hypothetical protein
VLELKRSNPISHPSASAPETANKIDGLGPLILIRPSSTVLRAEESDDDEEENAGIHSLASKQPHTIVGTNPFDLYFFFLSFLSCRRETHRIGSFFFIIISIRLRGY